MEDINNVTLVARLTRAPEMKGSILPLRLAFTTRQKNGEQWGDKSNYIDAIVFGRSAEALAPMLDKGTRVVVAGNLEWREFTDRGGTSGRRSNSSRGRSRSCRDTRRAAGRARRRRPTAAVAPRSPSPATDRHRHRTTFPSDGRRPMLLPLRDPDSVELRVLPLV